MNAPAAASPDERDVVVVGAGIAGLRALHTLRGRGLAVTVLEAGDGVGGVWNWNRYPGARCDVESYDYSYSFSEDLQQEWRWSERYATQPEILRYLEHVADRFDLRRDIVLGTRVHSAVWDDEAARWLVTAETGLTLRTRFLVMATGQLSTTKGPQLAGAQTFAGEVHHTGAWPHTAVEFAGKRVGIIGTGSSGMQMAPTVAPLVEHLTVFQRTANYSVPANNGPVSDEEDALVKATYAQRRETTRNSPTGLNVPMNPVSALEATPEEREALYEANWPVRGFGFVLTYSDLLVDEAANATASDFIRRKIGALVEDPATREKLLPRGFPFGSKRPSVDSSYYPTFNRDNVSLVDLRSDPIMEVVPEGVRTASGVHPLDMLVYATGFDVFTGSLLKLDLVGRDGVTLRQRWADGPRTYLGLMTSGFPNLFIIAGPGSPSLLSNVIVSTEQHVDFIADLIGHLDAEGVEAVEPTLPAVDDWVAHVNDKAQQTLYPKAVSYYNGDEVAGKPRVFMPYSGGVRGYRRILQEVQGDGYRGFALRRSPQLAQTSA